MDESTRLSEDECLTPDIDEVMAVNVPFGFIRSDTFKERAS